MGRPKLPEGERMTPVSIRLSLETVEFFRAHTTNPTRAMRKVLEQFVKKYNERT